MLDLHPGTGGSNPFLSSGESANFRSLSGGSFPRLIRSGPIPIGGFEEGEFKADSPTGEVAAQVCLRGADAVQLRAQEIDEAAKMIKEDSGQWRFSRRTVFHDHDYTLNGSAAKVAGASEEPSQPPPVPPARSSVAL